MIPHVPQITIQVRDTNREMIDLMLKETSGQITPDETKRLNEIVAILDLEARQIGPDHFEVAA